MQTGTKVKGSKVKLRDALFDCLKEKALADITVKEVCEKAGVNRVTFYRNYKALKDIISEVGQEYLDKLRIILTSDEKHGEDMIRKAVTVLYEAKDLDVYEGAENLFMGFNTEVLRMSNQFALDDWITLFPKADPRDAELALEIFIYGVLHVIASKENKFDCEDIIRIVLALKDDFITKYS